MKTVFRKVSGRVVARRVSDSTADGLLAKGWLDHNPTDMQDKPKKRGRPRKKPAEEEGEG